jgi:hypothetical protein
VLAPALGAAAVLVAWLSLRPAWRAPGQEPSGTLVAQAPRSEPAPLQESTRSSDQVSGLESKKAPESPAAIPQGRISERKAPSSAVLQSQETSVPADNKSLDQLKAKAATTPARLDNEKDRQTAIANSTSATAAAAPAPSPVAAVPQVRAAKGEAPAVAPAAEAKSNAPAGDKPAAGGVSAADAVSGSRPAADVPLNGRSVQALSILTKNTAGVVELHLEAPSGKTAWRAGLGGKIEHSPDAEQTWIVQTSPSQQDWLAGVAVSDTVCWLTGRNGSIARTMDGEHWVLVASPAVVDGASGQLPDWTGVTASSALAATVTSSGNLRYTTVDGGRTWRAQ